MKRVKVLSALVAAACLALFVPAVAGAQASSREPLVYVAGSYWEAGTTKACYWVNGKQIPLSASRSYTMAIAVAGSSVYVAGAYVEGGVQRAVIWVDGEQRPLPGTGYSANALAVADSVIYAAGVCEENGTLKACYWRDDELIVLSAAESHANAIAVRNGKVYVAGYYKDGGTPKACLWVDAVSATRRLSIDGAAIAAHKRLGEQTTLSACVSFAYAVAVHDGKVYTAGYYREDGRPKACLWIDGEQRTVSRMDSVLNAIVIKEEKVYGAGFYRGDGPDRACYWEFPVNYFSGGTAAAETSIERAAPQSGDGVEGEKTDLPGAQSSAGALAVADSVVYTSGYYFDNKRPKACYWVNEVKVDLPGEDSTASGIAVVE